VHFDLATAIKAMQGIGSVALQLPAVKALVDKAVGGLKTDDQEKARDAYHDLIADNADGHARVQDKLAKLAAQARG
jgi:hypothetical protein